MHVAIPVSAIDVNTFIQRHGPRFVTALLELKNRIASDQVELPTLSCIYNVYSRGNKQQGNELKTSRKVRAKINEYCSQNAITNYNMYEMPDLVGLTISVTYPSDINRVNEYLDNLVDRMDYHAVHASPDSQHGIATKHGQIRVVGGYHACHYYLKGKKGKSEPIVEVQVKTVLHDAWGLKTHDLTYKNSSPIDKLTRLQFEILGDMLAHLDQQSDALRQAIRNANIARETKERRIHIETILLQIESLAKGKPSVEELCQRFRKETSGRALGDITSAERNLLMEKSLDIFDEHPDCSCLLLTALATLTANAGVKSVALERISMWQDPTPNAHENIKATLFAHLVNFCLSDTAAAADLAEEALKRIDELISMEADNELRKVNNRRRNSLISSLAYYHAELIGTDAGQERSSETAAGDYLARSQEILANLGLIPRSDVSIEQMIDALAAENENSVRLYHSIDNAIFVSIRTARTSSNVKEALRLLDLQARKRPLSLGALPDLLRDLHEHHARLRLLQLETHEAAK